MRALPDAEMGDLVPHAGVDSDKTLDEKKQQERRLEEDEGAEYYVRSFLTPFDFRISKYPLHIMQPPVAAAFHLDLITCILKSTFTWESKGSLESHFVYPSNISCLTKAIWVELKGLIGTVRLRIQMTPQPPFIKNVTFTLMGLPQVQVSAVPMTERGINVLNLPLISGFVNNSIAAAANEYVAPKSMSLEVGKMLVGDDIKKGIPRLRPSDL